MIRPVQDGVVPVGEGARVAWLAVGAMAADHEVPGGKHGLGSEQQEAARFRVGAQHRQDLFRAAAAPVEEHDQRRRPARIEPEAA